LPSSKPTVGPDEGRLPLPALRTGSRDARARRRSAVSV